jgi:hypothetical protein
MSRSSAAALVLVPQPSAEALDASIDRYLASASAGLDRVVARAAQVEPRVKDIDKAAKLIDRLIETIVGLALGRIVGAVATDVAASFDRRVVVAVERALAEAARTLVPPPPPPMISLDGVARDFGGELRATVRRRLSLAPNELRAVMDAIVAAVRAHAPDELHVLVRMLELLVDDPLPADRFAKAVAEGWRCFCLLVANKPVETTMAPWDRWVARIQGVQPVVTPAQAELVAAGFINRIG